MEVQPLVSAVKGFEQQCQDMDLQRVLPVFLPLATVESRSWTGAFSNLVAPGVALAWAIAQQDQPSRYITADKQHQWELQGVEWRAQALRNLRAVSEEAVGTGALFRESGEPWLISLMYPDGLGPSRLLLTAKLAELFPRGYRVALPEQNRAYAFTTELDREDLETVESLVQRSYQSGDLPLSPCIFEPADLMDRSRD